MHNSLFFIGRWHAYRTRIHELWTSLDFSCPFYSFFFYCVNAVLMWALVVRIHALTHLISNGRQVLRTMNGLLPAYCSQRCQRYLSTASFHRQQMHDNRISDSCRIRKAITHASTREERSGTFRSAVGDRALIQGRAPKTTKMFRFLLTNNAISRSSHCVFRFTWGMPNPHNDCRNRATEMTTILPL